MTAIGQLPGPGAPERFDVTLAQGMGGVLQQFNDAGILAASDVHVARRLAELGGVVDEDVRLGVALAARAPRLGHVCVDLGAIRQTASADTGVPGDSDIDALPWPEPARWLRALSESPLVGPGRPLHLHGTQLYLDRLWSDERRVAAALSARAVPAADVDEALLAAGLAELFPDTASPEVDHGAQDDEGAEGDEDPDHLQAVAAATAVLRRLSVIAGGPGTGKTTAVARVLALLDAQASAAGRPAPRVALAAPTGKAAARLEEAVRQEAEGLPGDDERRGRLLALRGTTIHRLLGFDPSNRTRFRHDAANPLRHDVVVVDETSMVSLSMMARLLDAVRHDARLILVGDPEQLASVEAGAVLGDVVGPAARTLQLDDAVRRTLEEVCGHALPPDTTPAAAPIGNGVIALRHVHRHKGAIAELGRAVHAGDADAVVEVLRRPGSNVEWLDCAAGDAVAADLSSIRMLAVESGRAAIDAARGGEARAALDALGAFRLLCAHRRGPEGVATWTRWIESWLTAEVDGFATGADWYVGRPLIVTENDHALQLYNGDVGVVVQGTERPMTAAFERGGDVVTVSPTRLAAVDTVYAMTVHKSQGSQFETVAFFVPSTESRILTRELLYTAVTRAQKRLVVVGPEAAIRLAVRRPIARASGLRQALWGEGT